MGSLHSPVISLGPMARMRICTSTPAGRPSTVVLERVVVLAGVQAPLAVLYWISKARALGTGAHMMSSSVVPSPKVTVTVMTFGMLVVATGADFRLKTSVQTSGASAFTTSQVAVWVSKERAAVAVLSPWFCFMVFIDLGELFANPCGG